MAQPSSDDTNFRQDAEAIIATLAEICAQRGMAREVAVLAASTAVVAHSGYDNWNGGTYFFDLVLHLPADPYARTLDDREAIQTALAELLRGFAGDGNQEISGVAVRPRIQKMDGWRAHAEAWMRGEGINNQGRARSDNIASRQFDGLLFRSQAEINLFKALKVLGVSIAPLPVFIRGGDTFQRIEPDFVIVRGGVTAVVEVDGDTVHRETPAEAQTRLRMLEDEGALVIRVRAAECEDLEQAKHTARDVLARVEKRGATSRR